MTTFWRRIREIFYGSLPDESDVEAGLLMEETAVEDGERIESGPVQVVTDTDSVTVRYRGPLARSGRALYLHFGYGPGPWQKVKESLMEKEAEGVYTVTVPLIPVGDSFEFCFRNDLGEWDNNGGRNWSCPV